MIYLNNKKLNEVKIGSTSGGSCNLTELLATENKEYIPEQGVDGYSKVTVNVPTAGGDTQWKEIGYSGQPQEIADGLACAKEILKAKENGQSFSELLKSPKLTVYPNIGEIAYSSDAISKSIEYADEIINTFQNSDYTFSYSHIAHINRFICPNALYARNTFMKSSIVSIGYLSLPKCKNIDNMFSSCSKLQYPPAILLDNIESAIGMFQDCHSLKKIIFTGNPSKLTNIKDMFGSGSHNKLADNGVLIYDHRYNYSNIFNELYKFNPTWKTKQDYEIQEVTELSITADDCIGNATKATVHYKAITNGIDVVSGEYLTGMPITSDALSNPFEENPSYTDGRQIEVSFTYYGKTATTTITQGAKQHPTASVILQDQWKKSDDSLIPNPDELIYDGVYESFSNKGKYNSNAQMKIDFLGMPEFEIYLRNGGSNSSEIYVGKLDSETASKTDNQFKVTTYNQKGTDIGSYTKYILKNDGGKHSVIIGYYKGYGSHAEPDCAYILFKKPQE